MELPTREIRSLSLDLQKRTSSNISLTSTIPFFVLISHPRPFTLLPRLFSNRTACLFILKYTRGMRKGLLTSFFFHILSSVLQLAPILVNLLCVDSRFYNILSLLFMSLYSRSCVLVCLCVCARVRAYPVRVFIFLSRICPHQGFSPGMVHKKW